MDQSLIGCDGLSCDICSLVASLASIISLLLALSFAVGLLFLVYSGLLRIFSWGDERKIKLAKNGFKYSVYGFLICLLSYLMVNSIYRTLGFKGEKWWEIECPANHENDSAGENSNVQYRNEIPLGQIGARNNPVLIDNLESFISDVSADQYFFIRGLSAQSLSKSVNDLSVVIRESETNGKNIFAVLPESVADDVSDVESRLINLGEMMEGDSQTDTDNLTQFLKRFIEVAPTGIIPLVTVTDKEIPPSFENIWPKDENLESLASILRGVVYEENPIFSGQEETDGSGFTINLKYDEKNNRYYLDPEKPVSLEFDPGVDRKVAEEATVQIADTITALLPDNKYEDVYPVISNLMGSAERTSLAPLPDAVVKTVGSKSVTSEDVSLLENFIRNKVLNQESPGTEIFSPKAAPQTPEDAKPVTPSPSTSTGLPSGGILPSSGSIDYSSALPSGEIDKRISAISNYDVSQLKKNVATDRVLNSEERKELNKMLKGLQQEIAENTQTMNIPTELLMCIFEKESNFDGGARSETGCSGIGQVCMAETTIAVAQMKKYAPKHFEAFAKKFAEKGKDMEKICANKVKNANEQKRGLLRTDVNFGAAVAYMLADYKKRGGGNKGKPIGNDKDLARLTNNYGPGNSDYSASIMRCMKNNSWLIDRRKNKK